MQDGEPDEAMPEGGAGDPALREWALQAAAIRGTGQADPAVPAQPDVSGLVPTAADAPLEAAVAADAEPVPGQAPAARPEGYVPWFLPGGSAPLGPEDAPDPDADAPISARSWSEADLWSLPQDQLDARRAGWSADSAYQARLEAAGWPATGWPATDRPDAESPSEPGSGTEPGPASDQGDATSADATVADAPSADAPWPTPPRLVPGTDAARERRWAEAATMDGAPSPEEILRARVMTAGAGRLRGPGDRPRLTPATMVALVLLVASAGTSIAFMLLRGSSSLPTPSPRPAVAVASESARVGASSTPRAGATATATSAAASPTGSAPTGTPTLVPSATAVSTPTAAPPATLLADRHYDDGDAAIAYTGPWGSATGTGYAGGAVTWSSTAGATATLGFTGRSITWFGPVGPTRGSATVFIDGTAVGTISAFESSFTARRVLFTRDFGDVGTHTLKIVVAGSADHPTVAIDELVAGA